MTQLELSQELFEMFCNVPHRKKAVMILLFGVKYAREIEDAKHSVKEIVVGAGLPEYYQKEVQKGMNLAEYVTLK